MQCAADVGSQALSLYTVPFLQVVEHIRSLYLVVKEGTDAVNNHSLS